MTSMRAKVKVGSVVPMFSNRETGEVSQEQLYLHGVSASKYPADGSDENNTFAKFTPSLMFQMTISNPALLGKFAPGDEFYADFSPVASE